MQRQIQGQTNISSLPRLTKNSERKVYLALVIQAVHRTTVPQWRWHASKFRQFVQLLREEGRYLCAAKIVCEDSAKFFLQISDTPKLTRKQIFLQILTRIFFAAANHETFTESSVVGKGAHSPGKQESRPNPANHMANGYERVCTHGFAEICTISAQNLFSQTLCAQTLKRGLYLCETRVPIGYKKSERLVLQTYRIRACVFADVERFVSVCSPQRAGVRHFERLGGDQTISGFELQLRSLRRNLLVISVNKIPLLEINVAHADCLLCWTGIAKELQEKPKTLVPFNFVEVHFSVLKLT